MEEIIERRKAMKNIEIIKQYFNKYFKKQYFNESDLEFKSLITILNKKDKAILSAWELIEWLDQECPEGTEGTFDLSHDFIQKLRHRIENIKEK